MIMSNPDAAGAGHTSVNTICSLQCINAVLESIVIILRKPERNADILKHFDLASMISSIIEVIRIFELKQDPAMQPFENKIQGLSQNLELIIKLVFFSPQKLEDSSISLILKMLNYRRYRKTGFFAIYCTALMIQDCRSQQECIGNIVPVFSDEQIMKAIFEAIKEVDKKWKELKLIESKNSSHGDRDMLEKYENQNKSNVSAGNKQLKQESEAQKEFEDALAIRKSCL